MNRRDWIKIGFALAVLLWLSIATMPRKLSVLNDSVAHYYDDLMASQEFAIRKQQEKLSKVPVAESVKLDYDETLAKNLWASFRVPEALKLLLKIKSRREKLNSGYNQKLINTTLLIAGVCRDLNKLQEAQKYYQDIQRMDERNLEAQDPRLTRDEINLAMISYLRGDSEKDLKKRKLYFEKSLGHINKAQAMWHDQKDPSTATISNLLLLKYVTYRELGDEQASKQAYDEMKYLNKQLNRAVKPPRT